MCQQIARMTREPRIFLVTGGARSGKSALAERLCARLGAPRVYVATAQAWDDEMATRIAAHRDRRDGWTTREEPRDIARVLRETDGQGVRLVDCLTLWLANLGEGDPRAEVAVLCDNLRQMTAPVVLVTNELGQGIVPDNAMARAFRDHHGWMNQAVAEVADQVWMAVSGQPLRLKPRRDGDEWF